MKDNEENQNLIVKKVSLISIVCNMLLLILKIFIGFLSNSQGVIADSINSAGDIFASIISYIGSKVAYKPKDDDHPFGHGKAEYIYSQIIGISMIVASLVMINNSFRSIINNEKLIFSFQVIVVCLITIVVKLLLYIYTKFKYRINNSILIRANLMDHRNDIFLTTGTIIGIIFSYYGYNFVDGLIGILISIVIAITGIKIFKSSYIVLMDTNILKEYREQIVKEILKYKDIIHVDSLISKPIGNKYLLIIKISMDGKTSLKNSHDIGYKIKHDIISKFSYIKEVVVHINPR